MGLRSQLQTILEAIPNVEKVYYQPPESIKLVYPCIIYSLSPEYRAYADNLPYSRVNKYYVTVIDRNPDSTIREAVASMKLCSMDKPFTVDNLNHYPFTLYF